MPLDLLSGVVRVGWGSLDLLVASPASLLTLYRPLVMSPRLSRLTNSRFCKTHVTLKYDGSTNVYKIRPAFLLIIIRVKEDLSILAIHNVCT